MAPTEQNYAKLNKEALATIFGMKQLLTLASACVTYKQNILSQNP